MINHIVLKIDKASAVLSELRNALHIKTVKPVLLHDILVPLVLCSSFLAAKQ